MHKTRYSNTADTRPLTRLLLSAALLAIPPAYADSGSSDVGSDQQTWNVHGQITNVTQYHAGFKAPYSGTNSLGAGPVQSETTDATLFLGVRLWPGAALYLNPEIDQGFGFSNTVGMAGFASGEAYKVGANSPYMRLPRAFIRQVINLGGDLQKVADGPNQLADTVTANNITITLGKFSVVDIFDTNTYAHDPRADVLNWSIIEAGAFDYAADAWGYTKGLAVEWAQSDWTLRGGFFDLSTVPNAKTLDPDFKQFEVVTELEHRHVLAGHPGKLKVLGFINQGNMGSYRDAITLAQQTADTPSTALVRKSASRSGFAVNAEQEVTPDLGIFARLSANDGSKEAFEFTDINRSLSLGMSQKGTPWGRADDSLGIAAVINGLSADARQYFSDGGIGILVGDGRLHYGSEKIAEAYYAWQPYHHLTLGPDIQYVVNPAYNRDRGPVTIIGGRVHLDF